MRILVTGARGFVGSRTCGLLEASGHEVIRAVHRKTDLDKNTQAFAVDISDPHSTAGLRSVGWIDALVHCAGIAHRFGKTPAIDYQRVNVEGVQNVAQLAVELGAKTFVQLSSVLVYGPGSKQPISEDHTLAPEDAYAQSKLDGERDAAKILSGSPTRLVILRPAPIVGEGSRGNVSRLISAIDRGRFRWIGRGENRRSFVYVGDVARAVEFAIENSAINGVFNLSGGSVTVAELVDTIEKSLGKSVSSIRLPEGIARFGIAATYPFSSDSVIGRYRKSLKTWLAEAVYSEEKLKELGFRSSTSIQTALGLEVSDYLERVPK